MPKKYKEEKPKLRGILKKIGKNKGGLKAKRAKRVRFKELDLDNQFRLAIVRAELQARPGIVSTAAVREEERAAQRLLYRQALERLRAAQNTTQGILASVVIGVRRMLGL